MWRSCQWKRRKAAIPVVWEFDVAKQQGKKAKKKTNPRTTIFHVSWLLLYCFIFRFPLLLLFRYPPHVNISIERGSYAWKPLIVSTMLSDNIHEGKFSEKFPEKNSSNLFAEKSNSLCLWLDAGCEIVRPLFCAFDTLSKYGMMTISSGDMVREWTHKGTLEYLGEEGTKEEEGEGKEKEKDYL